MQRNQSRYTNTTPKTQMGYFVENPDCRMRRGSFKSRDQLVYDIFRHMRIAKKSLLMCECFVAQYYVRRNKKQVLVFIRSLL